MKQARFGIVYAAHIDADVSDAAFRLFVRLSSYADKDGYCFPGVALLAEQSGVKPRQIHKLLAELVQAGLIVREERYRADGSQCSSATRIPVPVEQVGVSQQDRGEWATMTPLEHTTRTHQKNTPLKNADPSGAGGRSEEHMGVYGTLPDDEPEMPENGEGSRKEWERKQQEQRRRRDEEKQRRRNMAPKPGTAGWLSYRFGQEQVQHNCGRGFLIKVLNASFVELRNEGYSNEDIEVMIRVFFSQNEQDIRAKMADIDVAIMFRAKMNSLKVKARGAIRAEKTGSRELSRNINRRIREQLNG